MWAHCMQSLRTDWESAHPPITISYVSCVLTLVADRPTCASLHAWTCYVAHTRDFSVTNAKSTMVLIWYGAYIMGLIVGVYITVKELDKMKCQTVWHQTGLHLVKSVLFVIIYLHNKIARCARKKQQQQISSVQLWTAVSRLEHGQ